MVFSLCALPLVSYSRSIFEAVHRHRSDYKWDRRFLLFCPIVHDDQESEIDSVLPLPPHHFAESCALVTQVPGRIRTCPCCSALFGVIKSVVCVLSKAMEDTNRFFLFRF